MTEPQWVEHDRIDFQHDGIRWRAQLRQWDDPDTPVTEPAQWHITSPDGPEHGDVTVVAGELDEALQFLAIRAAQHQQLAQPHLEQQALAERQHALVQHLAGKLDDPRKTGGTSEKQEPRKNKGTSKKQGRHTTRG